MPAPERYAFGDFTLDARDRSLHRGQVSIHLEPKAHDVLVALVRQAGRLVTKRELMDQVWPDAYVEERILTVHVSTLRKALGDANKHPAYIETVSRSGYRFVAPVRQPAPDRDGMTMPESSRPLEAYELVGRGRSHLLSASLFELPEAVSAFQAAISLDPTYAAAHAGLALARCAQAALRAVPHAEAYADAKAAALRALAMDDQNADARVALGVVLFLSEWDWVGAERSLRRALEISPNHSEAWLHYGSLMEALGNLDEGLRLKQQALERDPLSPMVHVQIAMSYWCQRRYDDAIVWARKALACNPRHLLAREFLAAALLKTGDFDAFLRENITQAQSFGAAEDVIDGIRTLCERLRASYASGGSRAVALSALETMTADEDSARGAAIIRFVVLHADAGNLDAAFRHLDRALDGRDPSMVHLAVAPQWDGLRADPRFADRLARMGLVRTH